MNKNFSPTVSVIIPMYNAEKYLPVCLESILNQTFTDFELLVVDDCSTDSSYAVAESYLEKFGGRLKIISLPQNTGSGAVPRNVGLDLSRGKYVYFMDADDLLLDTAIETLCDYAENYQAASFTRDRAIFMMINRKISSCLSLTKILHLLKARHSKRTILLNASKNSC